MNSCSSLRVQGELKYTSNQQSPTPKITILKFLRLVTRDTSLKSEFSQQYWGTRLSLNVLRNLTQVDRMGSFLQVLAEAAQTEFEVLSIRASLSKLDSYHNPWIAHWQENFYVIVWRVKGDRVSCDHAMGKRWFSRPAFEALLLKHGVNTYWTSHWQLAVFITT
ncbi:hypothetical protein GS682_02920 [Nostoc sp. B(2019)]|nr:hypothetical protein [Nostoc sp. B(2019)]